MARMGCSCRLLSGLFRPLEEFLARVRPGGGLAQLLDGAARLAVQVLRHHHLDGDEQAAGGPVLPAHALAGDAEGPSVRGARRDAHRYRRAPVRGHLDLRTQGQLGERHRHGHGQVVTRPAEHRMRLDVHPHVQVAGWAAALAGSALARDLDPLAVGHPGRDARLDGPRAHRPAAARAGRARVIDHQAAAPALLARLGDAERPLVPARLPGSVADRADPGHGAGLGAGAVAGRAGALTGQPQPDRGAVDRVAEAQRGLGLDVRSPARPVLGGGPAAAVEHGAEQVAQAAPGGVPGVAEQVTQVEVEPAAPRPAAGRHPEAAAEQRARLVVLLAPLLVGQHRVRLGDLLEALLGLRVALVRVRMILAGQLAVRRLDLGGLRRLGDPQGLVVILLEVVLRAHPASLDCLVTFLIRRPCGLIADAVRAGRRLGDRYPGRAQDPVAHLVTGLEDLDARVLGDVR